MGKWRHVLKIDLGATRQRPVLFNLAQEFYRVQPSSSWKNSLNQHFLTIWLHSRWTNVHFWANGDSGLKSIFGQQSSGVYSSTSHKNFTVISYPLHEKLRQISIISQFRFIPGEQMSTLWANGDMCLKSTFGQQSSGQYSLTSHKNFTELSHPLHEKIR